MALIELDGTGQVNRDNAVNRIRQAYNDLIEAQKLLYQQKGIGSDLFAARLASLAGELAIKANKLSGLN